MWSQVVFFLLVGLAFASNNPGWTENQEYIYKIHGRTLTGLFDVDNQFAGFLLKAKLRIQPTTEGKLRALITDAEYSQVHQTLPDGWSTRFPEEELSWKPLDISQKPFEMRMQNGKVVRIVVSKKIENWEANMIKGIASVFQLNTNAENALPSTLNILPSEHSNNAIFLTMEDNVSGETETLYQIRPVPDYMVKAKMQDEDIDFSEKFQETQILEVVKHKNYSNQQELPAFAVGFGDFHQGGKPATTQMGEFFTRDSSSHAFLSGNLRRYTVLHSSVVDTIVINPTITDNQKGVVVSTLVANLKEIKSQDEKIENIPDAIELGNLVYSYNSPFSQDREHWQSKKNRPQTSSEEDSEERRYSHSYNRLRPRRSSGTTFNGESYVSDEYYYTQSQPKIGQAPETPLVPQTTGYQGKSIKSVLDIVKEAVKVAKKIGSEIYESEKDNHEKSLDRFITLVNLIRLMNRQELEQVISQLYTNSLEGQEKAVWAVIRDAVPESGTGPALLTIESLIESEKITGEEAAQIISTLAKATREPTTEFLRTYFKLVKKDHVMREWPLNDTALITFSHLLRAAVTDKKFSESEFPVNSFGPYRTKESKRFVHEEVIPYLSEMLNKAIRKAETHKIHVYIQALGNIADPRILEAYEPYLEGKQQASQFQRMLMVLNLKNLNEVHPYITRSVLYRIYQNPSEHFSVRVAAVLNIMRSPTSEILQAMAQDTNFESNEFVKAVVKHSIEQFSEIEDEEFAFVRELAKSARPYLTNETFGINYGANYVRGYYIDALNEHYKLSAQFVPSEDTYIPKGMRYSTRSSWNGLYRKELTVGAYVSSIDDLLNVLYKQTKTFKKQENQQNQHAQEQEQFPMSSQNIAKLLNMKPEEREQLEGFLNLDMGVPHRMLSFDNTSIEQLPECIKKLEQEFRNGKKINHYKLLHNKEMTLAFPTIMGIQFVYTYRTPMLIKAQGEVKAVANPPLSQDDYLQQPDQVKIQTEMRVTVTTKTQGRIGFVAPFEHQHYVSGYDKHLEFNMPKTQFKIEINLKENELKVEIEPKQENKINLLHYHTKPYTAKFDVTDLEPLSSQQNVKVLEPNNMQGFNTVIGEKTSGVAIEVEVNHERQSLYATYLGKIFTQNGWIDGLRELWQDGDIQNSHISISYLPERSSVRKIILRSKYDQEYKINPETTQSTWKLNEKVEPAQRTQELMKEVSSGIKNVQVFAWDNTIQFQGEKNVQYLFAVAAAKSNVDPDSCGRICLKRSSEDRAVKDYELHFVARNRAENVNGLDMEYSFQSEPKMESKIDVVYGYSDDTFSKVKTSIEHRRSNERKQYLKQLPLYEQCQQEMENGNKALGACTQLLMISNLLDRIEIKLSTENIDPKTEDAFEMIYDYLRAHQFPHVTINRQKTSAKDSEILMKIKFHEDLEFLNATLETQNEETIFTNIPVNTFAQRVFVAHPVFHLHSRVASYVYGVDSYRDFCTVDTTQVSTFSNRTYEARISNQWTLVALYAPKQPREYAAEEQVSVQKQLRKQPENYAVLVRQSQESPDKKEVMIVVSTKQTEFQVVGIELKPTEGQSKAQVTINGQQVEVNQKESQDVYNGFIQIYTLPNGELKVEVHKAFYVLYDGERVRLTATSDKLKDATRGLCGQFNDQYTEDFMTSENCFARKPEQFVRSFELEGQDGQQVRQKFAGYNKQCVEKRVPWYINVITAFESRREEQEDSRMQSGYYGQTTSQPKCMTEQTLYVQQGEQICFTIVPVPTCQKHCQPSGLKYKQLAVHCVQKSNAASLWKKQIDNGGSPDFSNKKQHKTVQLPVPERCQA